MSNLPLQPLFWDWSYGDGGKTRAVCRAKSPSHEYIVRMGDSADVYYVDYRKFDNDEDSDSRKDEPPVFGSVGAAQEWAQSTHYASKMQPHVKPSPTKVFELTYDCGDSYITLFMTTDKQTALDLMESVQVHDAGFAKWHGINDDADEAIADRYNDTHPLKPYSSKIFNSLYEDSFSEWARSYAGNSLVSQMSIIEHELFVKQGE